MLLCATYLHTFKSFSHHQYTKTHAAGLCLRCGSCVCALLRRAVLIARIEIAVQVVKVKREKRHIRTMACSLALDALVVKRIDRYTTESDVLTTDKIDTINKCNVVIRALRLVV